MVLICSSHCVLPLFVHHSFSYDRLSHQREYTYTVIHMHSNTHYFDNIIPIIFLFMFSSFKWDKIIVSYVKNVLTYRIFSFTVQHGEFRVRWRFYKIFLTPHISAYFEYPTAHLTFGQEIIPCQSTGSKW